MEPFQGNGSQINSEPGIGLCWGVGGLQNCLAPSSGCEVASFHSYYVWEAAGFQGYHRVWKGGLEQDKLKHKACSVQFSLVTQQYPTPCDPMNRSILGLPVHHQLPESTQTHVHQVGDAIQPSHPLQSPSPPAFTLSQYQGLFKGVSTLHQVAKVLEFQLQHQSFQ